MTNIQGGFGQPFVQQKELGRFKTPLQGWFQNLVGPLFVHC